jgi:hypothetical protein
MNTTVEYILNRLKEPSTWAGIAVFIGMFGISADTLDRITTNAPAVITALATIIAIFAPSQKKNVSTLVLNDATVQANSVVADEVSVTPAPGEPRV